MPPAPIPAPRARPPLPLRFLALFLPLFLLALCGALAYWSLDRAAKAAGLKGREMGLVIQESQILETALAANAADAAFLADLSSGFLREGSGLALEQIAEAFWAFAFVQRGYAQVRYLDEAGRELVRLNIHPQGPEQVPALRLKSHAGWRFFLESRNLPAGMVRVSRLDLSAEEGRLDLPHASLLRFASPVFGEDGERAGVVILALDGGIILNRLRLASENTQGQVYLVNPQGYWLLGPGPDTDWGFQIEGRGHQTLEALWPGAWGRIRDLDHGQFELHGACYSFATVAPGQGPDLGASLDLTADESWRIVSRLDGHLLHPPLGPVFLGFCAALAGLLAVVSWLWTQARDRRDQAEARLLELATIDGLTGLHNRRSFMDLGRAELARARRYGRPLGLLMFDVDHFKRINDSRGHDAGDLALQALAAAARASLREADILGRLGGEEFAAVLPETALPAAAAAAERLRLAVAGLDLSPGGEPLAVRVSLGVVQAGDGESLEDLLKRADQALYRAKEGGRDRVERG